MIRIRLALLLILFSFRAASAAYPQGLVDLHGPQIAGNSNAIAALQAKTNFTSLLATNGVRVPFTAMPEITLDFSTNQHITQTITSNTTYALVNVVNGNRYEADITVQNSSTFEFPAVVKSGGTNIYGGTNGVWVAVIWYNGVETNADVYFRDLTPASGVLLVGDGNAFIPLAPGTDGQMIVRDSTASGGLTYTNQPTSTITSNGLSARLIGTNDILVAQIAALTGGGATLTDITNIAGAFDIITSNGVVTLHGPQIAGNSNAISLLQTNALHTREAIADARTTDWLLSRSYGLTNRLQLKQTVTLGSNVLEFVCGMVYAKGKLFASTVTEPAYLIRFNNLDDLSDFTYTNLPVDDGWSLIYSPGDDRLYVHGGFNENDATNLNLTQINPDTLASTNVIAITNGNYSSSFTPALCTDGSNIWVSAREMITTNHWSAAVKYRMSDWSQQGAIIITNHVSATLCAYDGQNVFLGGNIEVGVDQGWIAKIAPTNLPGYTVLDLDSKQIEPDAAFVGDYMYVGMNDSSGDLYRIYTPDMTYDKIFLGVEEYCFSVFHDGRYIWTGYRTTPGSIVRFDPVTMEVLHFDLPTGENRPNEIVSDGQRLFVALFPASNGSGGFVPTAVTRITRMDTDGSVSYASVDGALTTVIATNGDFALTSGRLVVPALATNAFVYVGAGGVLQTGIIGANLTLTAGTLAASGGGGNGTTNANSFFQFTGALGAFPGSSQNNYNPVGWSTKNVVYMAPGADIDITGINANSYAGRIIWLVNSSSDGFSITLKNESGSSDDTNRFGLSGDIVIKQGEMVPLFYDSLITTRWHVPAVVPNSGVTAGTYTSVTVDARGLVTGGSNPSSSGAPAVSVNTNGVVSATNVAQLAFTNSADVTFPVSSNNTKVAEISATFVNGSTGSGAVVKSNAPVISTATLLGTTTATTVNSATLNNSGTLTGAIAIVTTANVTGTITGATVTATSGNFSGTLTGATVQATTINSATHNNSGTLTSATVNATSGNISGTITGATATVTSANVSGTLTGATINATSANISGTVTGAIVQATGVKPLLATATRAAEIDPGGNVTNSPVTAAEVRYLSGASGASEMASGNTGDFGVGTSQTIYYSLWNSKTNQSTSDVSGGTRSLFPYTRVLTNFYIISSGTLGNTQTNRLTVMTNGVATGILADIQGTSITAASDTTHSCTVQAGWEVGIRMVTTSSATVRKFGWALELK